MQIQQHKNEAEVIQLAALKDKSDRIMSVTILPNEGNRLHNCDVVGTGQGDFLVTYGPKGAITCQHIDYTAICC